jgi:hypothetical protein
MGKIFSYLRQCFNLRERITLSFAAIRARARAVTLQDVRNRFRIAQVVHRFFKIDNKGVSRTRTEIRCNAAIGVQPIGVIGSKPAKQTQEK